MASTHRIFRKNGISALASCGADMSSPSTCSLMVKHSDVHLQASIVLQFSLFLRGFDSEQMIQLVLDADNLVPRHARLEPTSSTAPQNLLLPILRNKGRSDCLYLFSLTLKQPCVVRYAQSEYSIIAPQSSLQEDDFAHIVRLAKSTQIYILFDYQWLPSAKSDRLWSIVNHPDRLSGFRIEEKSTIAYQQGDWTIFAPGASDVPPPAYGEIPRKRPRQSPTSSPRAPSPKRALRSLSQLPLSRHDTDDECFLSPTEKASTVEQLGLDSVQPSPTEKATTRSSTAPSRRCSPAQGPTAAAFTDTVSNAIDSLVPNAVAACLPSLLGPLLPSLVEAHVRNLLPELLESAVAPHTSSVASSQHPSRSPSPTISTRVHTGATPPTQPRLLNQLHRLLCSHITSHAHHLRTVMGDDLEEQIMDQVANIMDKAEEKFEEHLDNHRVDMVLVREDGIADLDKHCRTKLEDLTEQTGGIVEDAAERLMEKVWRYEENVSKGAEKTIEYESTTEDECSTVEERTTEALTQVKVWAVKEHCTSKMGLRQRTGIPMGVNRRRAVSEPMDL